VHHRRRGRVGVAMKAPWNTCSGMATVLSADDPASWLNSSW